MVYINKLKFENLYSYANGHSLTLSKNNLIVGPNNSGKTNILRITKLLIDTLAHRNDLSESKMFPKKSTASLEIDLRLSKKESQLLVKFLSFYPQSPNNASRFYQFSNFDRLSDLFRDLVVKLSWKKSLDRSGFDAFVELTFSKIGLVFFSRFWQSSFTVSNKSDKKDSHSLIENMQLHKFLEILSKSNNPILTVKSLFESNPNKFLNAESYRRDANYDMPDKGRDVIQDLIQFLDIDANSTTDISLADMIGKFFENSIRQSGNGNKSNQIFMSQLVKEIPSIRDFSGLEDEQKKWFKDKLESLALKKDLEFTDYLNENGNNLSQFLFSLRNSPKLSDRKKYSAIKNAFDYLCKSDNLEFDVILDYMIEKRTRVRRVDLKSEPRFPKIIIINKTTKIHYPLEQVGSGISEILYLLTTAFGTEDSVILMDEPTLNLHPPKMRALISHIQDHNKTNQFVIVTHSPELTHYQIFEKSANILYVKKINEQSKLLVMNKEEFDEQRSRLKHQIDTRIFFAKTVILTEGESDKNLFGIAEYLQTIEPNLNLANNDVLVVNVGGNSNFAKYQKLLDTFSIPYIVFSDRNSLGLLKHLPHCFMTKESIDGDQNIILIEYGNLENLLREIDGDLYHVLEREYGNSKPTVAFEFAKQISEKNPDALNSIKSLIMRSIEMSKN